MKTAVKILKAVLGMLLGIFGFVLLLCLLVYFPPVQRFAVRKVSETVSEATGMRLSIEKFRLRFPLGVSVEGASLVTAAGDTLAGAGSLKANMGLLPLLAGTIHASAISISDASSVYRDTVSRTLVRSRLDRLNIKGADIELRSNTVRVSRVALSGADVSLELGRAVPDTVAIDTAVAAPWRFAVGKLDIRDTRFGMRMLPENITVSAWLPDGRIRRACVDLGRHDVRTGRIRLGGGSYAYIPGNAAASEHVKAPSAKSAVPDTLPWTINAGSIRLDGNSFAFGDKPRQPAGGFDPRYIRIDSLDLLVDGARYKGGDISATLRKLSLKERSGLAVRRGEGSFSMNGEGLSLKGFILETPDSRITAEARAGAGITSMNPEAPLSASVSASAGAEDIFRFLPATSSLRRLLSGRALTVAGDFSGRLGDISISRIEASLPGFAVFDASGRIVSLDDPRRLSGSVTFEGSFTNLGLLKGAIPDTALRRRIDFPRRITLSGRGSFSPGRYELSAFDMTARGGTQGRLTATASVDTGRGTYDADIKLTDFPLGDFLPRDSLGSASLGLTVSGQGFDPAGGMAARLDLTIDSLDYNGFRYSDMILGAGISDGNLSGNLKSSNEALSLDLDIRGRFGSDRYAASLRGGVWRADIMRMGFSANPFAFETELDIAASVGRRPAPANPEVSVTLDSTIVRFGDKTMRVKKTTLKAISTDSLTTASVRSGDLKLDFFSSGPLDSLPSDFASAADEIKRQLAGRKLDMEAIQQALPRLKLTVTAGRNNLLRDLAALDGMDFNNLEAGIDTSDAGQFGAEVEVNGLKTGAFTLDTLNLQLHRRGERLQYALRFANRPGNVELLALLYTYGYIGGNRAQLNVYQKNRDNNVGFRFGFDAELLENSVRATMTPSDPTLGYEPWTVNDGNYVEYGFDGGLAADLRLRGPGGKYVDVTSAQMKSLSSGALRLRMEGIEIGYLPELFPTAPPLGGSVSSDLTFGMKGKLIAAAGTLGIDNFSYRNRRVADISAGIDFQSDTLGRMKLEGRIDVEGQAALTADGYYSAADSGNMDFNIGIPDLPVAVAGAFLPPDIVALSGSLEGRFSVSGAPASPIIEGDAGFRGGRADILITGTTFGISEDRITVHGGRIAFNGFGLTDPANRKLRVDGGIDIADFRRMLADMRVSTDNFQAVGSTRAGGSQIYGSAALDMDVTARGPFDGLTVRGNVGLRRSTDITYILRNRTPQITDRSQDIVTFMVFADSLAMAEADRVTRLRRSGVDLLVSVGLERGMKATLSLDEQGENRVEMTGEGTLAYSINSQGDMRLTGRYVVSGGTVYYRPPIIAQKIFAVEEGSFVEWNGDPGDPAFSVTAKQTTRSTVTTDTAGQRSVDFEISIIIAGSLANLDLRFDLAAPSDRDMQNRILMLGAEQRMQQALSLLLYNQYTGPGVSSQGRGIDARDQLNAFISREVNRWARDNLKGVDFSVGISTKSDIAGNEFTDYSYSFSKRLFSDRVRVTVGGRVSDNAASPGALSENLIDDITLEYRLTDRDNMFLKLYRYNTRESILEGEVVETGAGFLMRKRMGRLGDLFRLSVGKEQRRLERRERREERKARRSEREADAEKDFHEELRDGTDGGDSQKTGE